MKSTNATLNQNFKRYKALGYPDAACVTLAAMDNILDRISSPPRVPRSWHEHVCLECNTKFECNCVSDPCGNYPAICGDCEMKAEYQYELHQEDKGEQADMANEAHITLNPMQRGKDADHCA